MEHQNPHERLLRLSEVRNRTGLGRSAIYARIADGSFPKPVPLGMRKDGRASTVGFPETEVDLWIANAMASRGSTPVAA